MAAQIAARRQGLAFLLAGCLIAAPAHAQWTPNGVPLTTAPRDQDGPIITTDGAGGAIVVWGDARDYSTRNTDLYAQRVTADGLIAPGWLADGVPVCTDSARQDQIRIAADGAGGAYVVWFDTRNYAASQSDVYIQRLTPTGAIAPGWVLNGNPVCTVVGDVFLPKVASDGTGGAFVVWEDFRRGSLYTRDQADLYAQRITPEGKPAPGWPVDGLQVCTASGDRTAVNVLADEAGGLFIDWSDARNLASSRYDIYGLRITGQGEVAQGWAVDGVPICTAPSYQSYSGLVSDDAGGFIVAWLDARTAHPNDVYPIDFIDIYAQRVTSSGSIAPGWPVNGIPICTAPQLQQDHEVISDGAGGAIVVWSDYRDRYVTGSDLYAQRVLASGQIAPDWPVNGVALRRGPGFELGSTAVADGMGGALVAMEITTPYDDDLYVQHVTAAGAIAPGWDPDGEPLCTAPEPQYSPTAVADGKMGMIVAWQDGRTTQYDVYAQRVGGDIATPTLISLVSAAAEPGRVVLTWSAGATRPSAAVAYRREASSDWAPLGAPREDGDGLLVFEDHAVSAGRYAYRLGYAGPTGERFTPEVWVKVPGAYVLALAGFAPNPAMSEPVVSLSLASREAARLEVFDVSGRAVLAREVGSLGPGSHRVAVGRGGGLAAGVYWLRLTQQGKSLTAKSLVAR